MRHIEPNILTHKSVFNNGLGHFGSENNYVGHQRQNKISAAINGKIFWEGWAILVLKYHTN